MKPKKAIDIDDKLLDGYLNQIGKHSGKFRRSIYRVMTVALNELMTDDKGRVTDSVQNVMLLEDLARSDIFDKAGFSKYRDEVVNRFRYRIDTANSLMKNIGVPSAVIDNLDELPDVGGRINRISKRLGTGKQAFERQIASDMVGISLGERTKKSLVDSLSRRGGALASYSHTVANTELMAMDRFVRTLQTDKAGIDKMKYVGPSDRITRPFCSEWLDRVESVEFWDSLENDTGPQPVSEYCGGYNCRHRLIPWRDDWGL